MKHLGINLNKELKYLYKNDTTLIKLIEEDTN
jgi:hypothetical protein